MDIFELKVGLKLCLQTNKILIKKKSNSNQDQPDKPKPMSYKKHVLFLFLLKFQVLQVKQQDELIFSENFDTPGSRHPNYFF